MTKELKKMEVSKHFLERYAQRILEIDPNCEYMILREKVLNDMIQRMTDIEKNCFTLLALSGPVKIPLGNVHLMVIDNNTLITVY